MNISFHQSHPIKDQMWSIDFLPSISYLRNKDSCMNYISFSWFLWEIEVSF